MKYLFSKNLPYLPVFLLATSVFYSHNNLGMSGLYIPNNSLVLISIALSFILASFYILKNGCFLVSSYSYLMTCVVLLLVISAFFSGVVDPLAWFFRVSMVLFGLLFFLLLPQILVDEKQWLNSLLLILVAGFFHSLVGLVQFFSDSFLLGWVPHSNRSLIGFFQQVNVHASFMATLLGLSLYLFYKCILDSKDSSNKIYFFICCVIFLSSLNISLSGSRVGLLSSILVVVLSFCIHFKSYYSNMKKSIFVFICLFLGVAVGYILGDGVLNAYSKFERLSEAGLDVRPHVYRIAWDAFLEHPFFGHGIGSFQKAFHDQAIIYINELNAGPVIGFVQYDHPHNELLLWAVEGGSVALTGFVVIAFMFIYFMYKSGFKRFLLLVSVLLPITLHTMVEHPFYTSYFHFFLFIYLLAYFVFSDNREVNYIEIGFKVKRYFLGFSLINFIIVLIFCSYSLMYSGKLYSLLFKEGGRLEEFVSISKHPYFVDFSTMQFLKSNFYNSIGDSKLSAAVSYIEWAEGYLELKPDIIVYYDYLNAIKYLGDVEMFDRVKERALTLFPEQPLLLSINFS